jgi:hypothetical protein
MSQNNLKFTVDLRNSDSGFSEEFELLYDNISSEIIARISPNQSEDHWKNLFFELFDNAEMGMTSTEGLLFEKARQSLTNMAFDKLGWSDVIVQFTGIEINGTSVAITEADEEILSDYLSIQLVKEDNTMYFY